MPAGHTRVFILSRVFIRLGIRIFRELVFSVVLRVFACPYPLSHASVKLGQLHSLRHSTKQMNLFMK